MSDLAFERILRKKVEDAYQNRAKQILDGVDTIEQYKSDCGYLSGLKEAVALIDEVHKDMFGEEKR